MTDLVARVRAVAAVAAAAADAVDRDGRFPHEAVAAMREQRLLGCAVEPGPARAELRDLVLACELLGRACASSAMIFAMHQVNLANLLTHAPGEWHRAFLARVADEQLLVASSTSEAGPGTGDIRHSRCALERREDGLALGKDANTISFGEEADAILATARRDPDAAASDQVLVLLLREQVTLSRTRPWNTMGVRGTGGHAFRLEARGVDPRQVLPAALSDVAAESMVPVSHLLWAGLWFGIAGAAVDRARIFARGEARRGSTSPPPALAEAVATLDMLGGLIRDRLGRVESVDGLAALGAPGSAVGLNALKVSASRLAVEAVQQALQAVGLAGYREGTPFSMGRSLRDVMSAPLMISNDRILSNTAGLLLLLKADSSLGVG